MCKRIWLCALSLCVLIGGCGGSVSESDANDEEMVACETAAPAFAEAAEQSSGVMDQVDESKSGVYTYEGSKEGLKTDGLTYFTFSHNSVTHMDERGEALLLEAVTQPFFYSQCPIQTKWINAVLDGIQKSDLHYGQELLDYAQQNKKDLEDAFYCHSHYVSRGVARHDAHVISLLTQSSVYSGGAHPNMTQTALNLDMVELKVLTLEDVINPERCSSLRDLVQEKVEGKFSSLGQTGLFDHYQEIISDAMTYGNMTPYWYFNDQGLVIFFNQYELAAYAAGVVKIVLEYELLNGILEESYFPDDINGWITNISVDHEQTTGKKYYDVTLGEGENIYITLGGTATHVQLSEVSLVEQTAVSSTMLFSANYLNAETSLALTVQADPEKTYAVTYCDETGGPKILYLRNDQILNVIE